MLCNKQRVDAISALSIPLMYIISHIGMGVGGYGYGLL